MRFRPLPPGLAKEMIKGHTDVLTPAVKAQEKQISGPCPRCGTSLQSRLHPTQIYGQDDLIPRLVAYCVDCGYSRDPKTGLIVSLGSSAGSPDRPPRGGA